MKMKKIREAFKNTALYGGLEKEEFQNILPEINRRNRSSLRIASSLCALMFLGLLLSSFFSNALGEARIFYGIMTLSCSAIYAMTYAEKKKINNNVWFLWYLLYFLFGTCAVVLNTYIRPELSAVTLCVFLTAGPLMIVDRPVRILSLQVLLWLEYILLSKQIKDPYLAFADSVNMICCLFLGFGVYIRLNHVNLREALQAVHLRKERDMDKLTGLLNKAAITAQVKALLANSGKQGALVILDLDNFKHINDTYGHIFGDTVLHQVGNCIRQLMPDNSLCGRFGGDEFLLLLPDMTKENIPKLLDDLLSATSQSIALPLSEDSFGMSIGAAFYPESADNLESLIQLADRAMYQVKKTQKNGWNLFQS